jgi:1,2-diacylglycerol 3-beta-glucosyltransferase
MIGLVDFFATSGIPDVHVHSWWLLWPWSYCALVMLLLVGLARLRRSRPVPEADAPTVSVVVTARNEAQDLPRCLAALAALDYPADKLQLVLVNDRSTDATGTLLEQFAAAHAHAVVLHSAQQPNNGLEGKARGLAHGMDAATGEWILITDADAAMPSAWVRHMMGVAGDDAVMVGGALAVAPTRWWGWFEGVMLQFLLAFSHAAAGLGIPFACIGPNMGIRADAYRRAGGLVTRGVFVAEDLALFEIARSDGRPIRLAADLPTTVTVVPVPRPVLLFSQLRRWLGGGVVERPAVAVGLVVALAWGLGVLWFFLAGWTTVPRTDWATFAAAKVAVEAVLLGVMHRRLGGDRPLRRLLALQLYQAVALLFLPVSFALTRRLRWVGDGYAVIYRSLVLAALLAASTVPLAGQAPPPDPRAAALAEAYLAADRDSVDRWIDRAVALSRTALVSAPASADAHYWLAAALGRRAARADLGGALRAGRESFQEARRALALDSLHPGAHAIIARLNEEGARYSWPFRLFIATATGITEVRRASAVEAEREYRTAVRLDPASVLYHHDLGRFLATAGRIEEAEAQWRLLCVLPPRAPVDEWLRGDLRRRIDEAARRPRAPLPCTP